MLIGSYAVSLLGGGIFYHFCFVFFLPRFPLRSAASTLLKVKHFSGVVVCCLSLRLLFTPVRTLNEQCCQPSGQTRHARLIWKILFSSFPFCFFRSFRLVFFSSIFFLSFGFLLFLIRTFVCPFFYAV